MKIRKKVISFFSNNLPLQIWSLKCSLNSLTLQFFSSPKPKAHGELIVYQSSRRPSVRPSVCASVCVSTLSNINISATSKPIATKFYLKHHWGGGKAASVFFARSG